MGKVAKSLGVFMVALILMGCGGGEEKTVKLTKEADSMKEETILVAKGDILTQMTQTSIVTIEGATEDLIQPVIDEFKGQIEGIEGVECTSEISGDELTLSLIVDMTNDESLKKLSEKQLIAIDGISSKISLKKSIEEMTAAGWKEESK